jgi:hypothetical protein
MDCVVLDAGLRRPGEREKGGSKERKRKKKRKRRLAGRHACHRNY